MGCLEKLKLGSQCMTEVASVFATQKKFAVKFLPVPKLAGCSWVGAKGHIGVLANLMQLVQCVEYHWVQRAWTKTHVQGKVQCTFHDKADLPGGKHLG